MNKDATLQRDYVQAPFASPAAINFYGDAAVNLGLWKSEEMLITRYFPPGSTLLDIGCGAGRVAFGLSNLGFARVTGIDFSSHLIEKAKRIRDRNGAFETGMERPLNSWSPMQRRCLYGPIHWMELSSPLMA